jgi:hypothetical protein
MMKLLTCIFSLLLILFAAGTAISCTCTDYGVPSCKRFSDAEVVFVGKIQRITSAAGEKNARVTSGGLNSISWDSLGMVVVHFKVEKAYKGFNGKTIKAFTYKGTSCDLEVKKGQRWMIYAIKDEETGELSFGACGGNYKIKDESDEPSELEDVSQVKITETIVGRVAEDSFSPGIKDLKVTVEGEGVNLSTVTDKYGYYKFAVPPSGRYKIKVFLPYSASLLRFLGQRDIKESPTETETVFQYEAETKPGKCDYDSLFPHKIDLKATAVITGKFSTPDAFQFPQMFPRLCRVRESEEATLSSCVTDYDVKPDGTFSFDGLREGRFVMVVSEDDFPETHIPFFRHYYPGVKNFADAEIIDLKQGERLTLADFKLPSPVKTREVTGRLFWKDGSPVTAADLTEEGVYFQFYNSKKPSSSLSMSHYMSPSEVSEDGVKFNEDGGFSFRAFVGVDYLFAVSARNKNGKSFSTKSLLKIDENLQPLVLTLEPKK